MKKRCLAAFLSLLMVIGMLSQMTLWAQAIPLTYTVTYNDNGSDGGTVPTDSTSYTSGDSVTVLGNTSSLTKSGYIFSGWNTEANGGGTGYSASDTFSISANTTLYAVWTAVWDGSVATAFAGGNGSTSNPYQIANGAQLAYLAQVINSSATYASKSYILTADIYLNDTSNASWASSPQAWTPIGNSFYALSGTFDGDGHTVSGVYINNTSATAQGLLGYLDAGAVIRNVGVMDSSITASKYVGGVVGYVNNSTVTNCYHTGTLTATTSDVGGIAGEIYGGTVTNCYNMGAVSGSGAPWAYAGGVVGRVDNGGAVSNCYNTGAVQGGQTVGGIVGTNGYTGSGTVSNCYNTGTVTASADRGTIVGTNASGSTVQYCYWVSVSGAAAIGTNNGNAAAGCSAFTGSGTSWALSSVSNFSITTASAAAATVSAGASLETALNTWADTDTYSAWKVASSTSVNGGYPTFAYHVTYNGNGSDGGSAPTDSTVYSSGNSVTVLGNTGSLTKSGYTFSGWATSASATSATYTAGSTFRITTNPTLYAVWTIVPTTYNVTYNGNGSDGGSVPTDSTAYSSGNSVTVLGNTGSLTKSGYTFSGWATSASATTATYTADSTFSITANTTLYAIWTIASTTYNVTYDGNGLDGGSVPTDSTAYSSGNSVTVLGNTGSLTKSGYTFSGWATSASATAATYTAGSTFSITANTTLYAIWTVVSSSSSGSSSSGGSSSTIPTTSLPAAIDGTNQAIGVFTTATDDDGQSKTIVDIDEADMKTVLASKSAGDTVTLSISSGAAVTESVLTGQTVQDMEDKSIVFAIQTENAFYEIPAAEINIAAVSGQIGSDVMLSDVKVTVKIAEASEDITQIVEQAAENGEFSIVATPIDFTIECEYNGTTVSVSKFNSYVERMVAIPSGVDPSKITTAVVVADDGSIHPVPTVIVQVDGTYYAKISSLTNSVYAVVAHSVTFADMESHWAQAAVNDMGSRMVVTGTKDDLYEPNRSMTRAEFAAIMVRALGLSQGEGVDAFTDVSQDAWYSGYVKIAVSYGIMQGYEDGTFRPQSSITREQAMTIVARAMKLTELETDVTDDTSSEWLRTYSDQNSIAAYAKTAIAACLDVGIVTGSTDTTLSPKGDITRAQVAVMAERLLQQSGLI